LKKVSEYKESAVVRIFPAILAFVFVLSMCDYVKGHTAQARQALKIEDVIDMLDAGLSSEIVVAKIKSSPCQFDTSPAALKRLKASHVPDTVILAMVQAAPRAEDSLQTGAVKCSGDAANVSVWVAPGTLTVVASPKCGEMLDILEAGELWMRVRTQNGKVGYIPRQAVTNWVDSKPPSAVRQFTPAETPHPARPLTTLRPAPSQAPQIPNTHLGSACSPAIESTINSEFEGWSGETIFKLVNGQIWEQAEYDYDYEYEYRPDVTIYQTNAGCRMKVEGVEETILVRRIH